MDVVELPVPGLLLIKPKVFRDERGFFLESYKTEAWKQAGVTSEFVQDNHSRSTKHTVRGMHFQRWRGGASPLAGQAKLVRVSRGRIFDVAVDLRIGSPTFGRWHGEILDDEALHTLFIPVGFAHGFCVLSDVADVQYKTSSVYDPTVEAGFAFDDPAVGVEWPITRAGGAVLSKRDAAAPPLSALREQLAQDAKDAAP